MKKIIPLLLAILGINGCSTIAVGTSEVTGVALVHDRRAAGSIIHDEQIETQVSLKFSLDNDISKYTHINSTSYDGILLLTGEVQDQFLRNRINEIARNIKHVRLVHNQMSNQVPTSFSVHSNDSVITARVKLAFSSNKKMPGLDATRIKVVTENSRVFLMGLVHKAEGDIATEITQGVLGVRAVIKVFEYF